MLAENKGLGYSKEKIWDTRELFKYQVGCRIISAYKGIKISLLFDMQNTYLTIAPSYIYADDEELSKEEKKVFADAFNLHINNGRPNKI